MGKYGRLVNRLIQSADYWAQAAMRRFVSDIDRRLGEQKMTRAQLAEKLGATPAYVSKVMRGDVNFTLETMTKLAMAVGGKLQVSVVDRERSGEWNTSLVYERMPLYSAAQTRNLEFAPPQHVANQPMFNSGYSELAA